MIEALVYSRAFFIPDLCHSIKVNIFTKQTNKLFNIMTKKDLKPFYGKEIVLVSTTLRGGEITVTEQRMRVYDPTDLSKRIRPADSCDIVIGGSSWNSDYIYDTIGRLHNDMGHWDYNRYEVKSLMTFTFENKVESIKRLHLQSIKKAVDDLKVELALKTDRLDKIKI